MRISFGETKLNQKFIDVIEQDHKYVKWFTKKYAESQKRAHQAFIYFIGLYVERMELTQEGTTVASPRNQAMISTLKPKTKGLPSCQWCRRISPAGARTNWTNPGARRTKCLSKANA